MAPTVEQINSMKQLGDVFTYVGADPANPAFAAVLTALGITVAAKPELVTHFLDKEVEDVLEGITDITVLVKAQFRNIISVCRLVAAPPRPPTSAPKTDVSSLGKFKMSHVVSQSSDVELVALDGAAIKSAYDRYKTVFGTLPPPQEELSTEQLSAVKALLDADLAPYVDFAIWGPFGNRLMKKLKLHGVTFSSSGALVPLELSGPPDIGQWVRAYTCLRTALVSWGAVDLGHLDRYSALINRYSSRYGAACWLQIYQADVRMRGEQMERIRRSGESCRALAVAAGGTHPMNPARPWDWVWGEACDDTSFWRSELEEPALLALTRNRTGLASANTVAPQGGNKRVTIDDDAAPPAKLPRAHMVEGNHFTANRRGRRLCDAFQKGECPPAPDGTCSRDPSRVHQCSRCLSNGHGASTCTRTDFPASRPAQTTGKGGGKAKGRGKGKRGKWQY